MTGSDPQGWPRYVGIPSFMRLPFGDAAAAVDIGLLGVPFDGGVTFRPGARHGPRAVRDQSSLVRRINQATGDAPFEIARCADLGDVLIERPFALETAHAEIERAASSIVSRGIVPLSIGGDHSISLPLLRAAARAAGGPLGLLHVDAHCDAGDDYFGSRFHHGAPFRRAVEEGLIDPRRAVQIGIRGTLMSRDQWSFSRESGMRVIPIEEFRARGPESVAAEAVERVAGGECYLTFDIDALDPVYAPGTGTPEIGGMTSLDALLLLRGFREADIVAADIVEVSPPFDVGDVTSLTAATIAFEILCLLAAARQRRSA